MFHAPRLFTIAFTCLALGPLAAAGCGDSSSDAPGAMPQGDAGPDALPDATGGGADAADGSNEAELTAPQAPFEVFAVAEATQVTLSWAAVPGAVSYDIYWGMAAGITTSSTKIAGATSPYVHTGLATDTTYFYRVAAVNAVGATLSAEISARVFTLAGTFASTGDMNAPRVYHAATRLQNGKVLLTGGEGGAPVSAELYDPATGTFTATGAMKTARQDHVATLLADGRVLITGGLSGDLLASAEIFDPASESFTVTGSMSVARRFHSAVLLPNGKVLVVGGTWAEEASTPGEEASTPADEIFDPATGKFTATGNSGNVLHWHTATLLQSGKVLVAGGALDDVDGTGLASASLYDPGTGKYTPTGNMTKARVAHTATLLPNGKVLIAGGGKSAASPTLADAELYDPATGTFIAAENQMSRARGSHAAALLHNGKVLLVAGFPGNAIAPMKCDLFDFRTGKFEPTGDYPEGLYHYTATTLVDGEVLIAGGTNVLGPRQQARLFR